MVPITSADYNEKYEIVQECMGHKNDVRVVMRINDPVQGFVTGSRDNVVKLWANKENEGYVPCNVYLGPTKYVSALVVLPPSDAFKDGLIAVGCHDNCIYGYALNSSKPLFRLHGHTAQVCALVGEFIYFVSGSWDKTAIVWKDLHHEYTLEGHTQAVWATAVFNDGERILTGSADATIKVWKKGVCINTFFGHTDCVRGLAITMSGHVLSCSNDTTIRTWTIDGKCLQVYEGHTNFVYSIALMPDHESFVTCSEDQTVKIWDRTIAKCEQTITIPERTLWSVSVLMDDSIVVGASGGSAFVLKQPSKSIVTTGVDDFYKFVAERKEKHEIEEDLLEIYVENGIGGVEHVLFTKAENPYHVANKYVAEHNHLPDGCATHIREAIARNTGIKLPPTPNEYFPLTTYYHYDGFNLSGMKGKLLEFSIVMKPSLCMNAESIDSLVSIVTDLSCASDEALQSLEKAVHWDDDHLFPVLDLMRVAAKNKVVGPIIANPGFFNRMLEIFKDTRSKNNRMLIIKILCNLFGFIEGEKLLIKFQERILNLIRDVFKTEEKIHKPTGQLIFNYAVGMYKGMPVDINTICDCARDLLCCSDDVEFLNRDLVAIGTMCVASYDAFLKLRSLNLYDALRRYNDTSETKVRDVLDFLIPSFKL